MKHKDFGGGAGNIAGSGHWKPQKDSWWLPQILD